MAGAPAAGAGRWSAGDSDGTRGGAPHSDGNEVITGIEVIFPVLIDHPKKPVLLSLGIWENLVDLAHLKRGCIALVPDTNHKPRGLSLLCHEFVSTRLSLSPYAPLREPRTNEAQLGRSYYPRA